MRLLIESTILALMQNSIKGERHEKQLWREIHKMGSEKREKS